MKEEFILTALKIICNGIEMLKPRAALLTTLTMKYIMTIVVQALGSNRYI